MTVDRRPMGSGSIESRGDRHRVRLRVGGKKQTLGTYPTLERAQAVLSAALEQLEGKATGALTLRDWVAQWLEQRELGQEVRSTKGDASRLRAHVLSESWADDPLEMISRPMVQAWARSLLTRQARRYVGGAAQQEAPVLAELGRSLSRTTAGHALRALRVCFRDALEAGLVSENPCVGVRLPRVERTDDAWAWLTAAEVDTLLSCEAVPLDRRLLYTVAIYTGLRKGELWGLRWGDVGESYLTVRRSYEAAPKNGKHRSVPLLAPAREALEALRGGVERAPDTLVFPGARGRLRAPHDSAGLDSALAAAGIRSVRFHDLRHTCASNLLQGLWERAPRRLEDVRAWLGHSDLQVTQRYAHLAADYLRANDAGPKPAPNWSHLRELNPGPTVYETVRNGRNYATSLGFVSNGATEGPSFALAVRVLEAVRAGEPVERLAVELATQVLAIAATPAEGAARGGR